jgi:YhcH/YjgK/YiaL family protein
MPAIVATTNLRTAGTFWKNKEPWPFRGRDSALILDRLEYGHLHFSHHREFERAFAYLQATDWAGVADGRHVLEADRLFVIVSTDTGRGRDRSPLEFHRRYIDIQFVIAGVEVIGWRSLGDCLDLTEAYSSDRDIGFYGDSPSQWLSLQPGMFCVFDPTDCHAPLAGTDRVRKAVVKVLCDDGPK